MEKLIRYAKTIATVVAGYAFMEVLGLIIDNGNPVLALFIGMVFAFALGVKWGDASRKVGVNIVSDNNDVAGEYAARYYTKEDVDAKLARLRGVNFAD